MVRNVFRGSLTAAAALVVAAVISQVEADAAAAAAAAADASPLVQVNTFTDEPSFEAFLKQEELLKDQARVCGGAIDESVVGDLMKRGWFDSAMLLIEACVAAGRKVDGGVHQAASLLRKRVSEVTHFLQTAQQGSQAIPPAFEWAQSRDSVFINIKFAHKLDAPACIDLVEDKVDITPEGVVLAHTCKGKNKHFELDLKVFDAIDVEQTTWTMNSVGRGTLTLRKTNVDIHWTRLFKSSEHRPRNMHTWWKLHEKYEGDKTEMEKIKKKKESDAKEQAKKEEKELQWEKDLTAGDTKGEEKVAAEVVEDDPAALLEKAKKKQRAFARKKAKSETKKLVKQGKRTVKQLENELATAKKEQKEKEKTTDTDFKAKIKESRKDTSTKVADVATRLKDALQHIDDYTHPEEEESGAFGSLINSVKGLLFGDASKESEAKEDVEVVQEAEVVKEEGEAKIEEL